MAHQRAAGGTANRMELHKCILLGFTGFQKNTKQKHSSLKHNNEGENTIEHIPYLFFQKQAGQIPDSGIIHIPVSK